MMHHVLSCSFEDFLNFDFQHFYNTIICLFVSLHLSYLGFLELPVYIGYWFSVNVRSLQPFFLWIFLLLSLFSFWYSLIHVLVLLMVFHVSLRPCSFFFISFSLQFFSAVGLSSALLILFCTNSDLLLSPSSRFLTFCLLYFLTPEFPFGSFLKKLFLSLYRYSLFNVTWSSYLLLFLYSCFLFILWIYS